MRKKLPNSLIALFCLLFVGMLIYAVYHSSTKQTTSQAVTVKSSQKKSATSTSSAASSSASTSTETSKHYPDLTQYQNLSVNVSLKKQQMSILSDNQPIFTTTVSPGAADSPTPTGNFVIEAERGDFFYNASSGEGAYYWVSFKEHGIYLFHSVPTDQYGNEIPEEAAKLGTPSSHGCVRMSRTDAKWFYQNIPEGTSVTIQ